MASSVKVGFIPAKDRALEVDGVFDEALGEDRVQDLTAALVGEAEGELQRERAGRRRTPGPRGTSFGLGS